MLARDAKIYKDTFLLADTLFDITKKFKSDLRSTLAKRIEDAVLRLSDIIVEANLSVGNERADILGKDFVVCYEQLQFLINLAVNRKQITFRQHANISRLMDGIGKQATGWRKSAYKQS